MKLYKIALCLLIGGLMSTPLSAQILENTSSLVKLDTKNDIQTKEQFVAALNKKISPDVIHKAQSVKEWRLNDLTYLKEGRYSDLNAEIRLLRDSLELAVDDYVLSPQNVMIYGYQSVEWIDTLTSAINIRYELLNDKDSASYDDTTAFIGKIEYAIIDKTDGQNPLLLSKTLQKIVDDIVFGISETGEKTSNLPTEKELEMMAGELYEVLFNAPLPNDFLSGLKIYLSPYYLDGYLGFSSSNGVIGRDEEIVIAASRSGAKTNVIFDTILHELGHVFHGDTLGRESNNGRVDKDEESLYIQEYEKIDALKSCYPEGVIPINSSTERQYFMDESYAEHFRMAILEKMSIKGEESEYEIYPDVIKFINQQLDAYESHTFKTLPTLMINERRLLTKEFGSRPLEVFNSGQVTIKSDITSVNNYPVTLDLLRRDEKTNEPIEVLKGVTFDENGKIEASLIPGDYALIIRCFDALLSYNDFKVN